MPAHDRSVPYRGFELETELDFLTFNNESN